MKPIIVLRSWDHQVFLCDDPDSARGLELDPDRHVFLSRLEEWESTKVGQIIGVPYLGRYNLDSLREVAPKVLHNITGFDQYTVNIRSETSMIRMSIPSGFFQHIEDYEPIIVMEKP